MKFWDDFKQGFLGLTHKQSPVASAVITPSMETWGVGPDWAPETYGEYYAKSVLVYSAVKMRADNIIRPPLVAYQRKANGDKEALPRNHPLNDLMAKVNPFWTRGDLWRATSTYLDLWGSCFWTLTRSSPSSPPTEIWPVRPDRMRIIGSKAKYIQGFVYEWQGRRVPLLPEEVIWFRHFNPLDELSGFSPVAALRLSADMGIDALKYNRNVFKYGLMFGNVAIETESTPTDSDMEDFYKRLKNRFAGPDNAFRPLVMGAGMKATNLGFSPREMEYVATLRWALEDVSRVFGIPKPMLADLENATYSNIQQAELIFWRNTIVPLLMFLQEELNEMLIPQFGPDLFVEFDLTDIEALQANINEVSMRQREDIKVGVLTINEVRAERNLKPLPWGDSFWVPLTMMPVTSNVAPLAPFGEAASLAAPRTIDLEPNGYRLYEPPALTDGHLDRLAELHVRRLTRHEGRFKEVQLALFDKQRRDVVRRLQASKTVGKQVGGELFSASEWREVYIRTGAPLMVAAIVDSAQGQIAEFGLGVSFDVMAPESQAWIEKRVAFWANRVNDETAGLLMQELSEAGAAGESIPQIQDRVEKVFEFNSKIRSERIARTEMQASTNRGSLEAYRQSKVVGMKMWLATLDDRTRGHHADAHRQTVPIDADFLVGGESIQAPGEGSPMNVINCRCSLSPVVSR